MKKVQEYNIKCFQETSNNKCEKNRTFQRQVATPNDMIYYFCRANK